MSLRVLIFAPKYIYHKSSMFITNLPFSTSTTLISSAPSMSKSGSIHALLLPVVLALFVLSNGEHIESARLEVKVSGRNLLQGSFNTDDPYYIVSHSENGGKTKSKIGQSDTKRRENNPDWKNEYVVMFDRNKKQYLHFHVLDKDKFKKDRSLGQVWLNLADYVDKGELATINLDTEGYLIVSSAVSTRVGSGRLHIPPKDHVPQTLQFTLSANHLTSKDGIGFIHMKGDPYVIVHSIDDPNETKLKEVGRTNTISSTNHPVWDEVLQFKYDPNMDQRIRFSVYDDDMFRHDAIDKVWMEVNDYVAKGYNYTLLLPKGGTITVTKL